MPGGSPVWAVEDILDRGRGGRAAQPGAVERGFEIGSNFSYKDPVRNLVTGAGGFIGRHLVEHLLSSEPSNELFTVCLTASPSPKVRHFQVSLEKTDEIARIVAEIRPDRVYHLAGIARVTRDFTFSQYFSANFLATTSLLEALERLGLPVEFFFASSVHVYGNPRNTVTESSPPNPLGAYGRSKLLAEEALRERCSRCPWLRVVVGRLYNCIGPGQPEGFVAPDLCRKVMEVMRSGETQIRTGPLTSYRRFTDVRDIVAVLPRLFSVPALSPFEIYNISSHRELQIRDMLSILLRLASVSPRIESSGDISPNEFTGLKLSTEKLQTAVSPLTFRPIEETLKDMLEWAKVHST